MLGKIMYFSMVVSNQDSALEFYTKLGFIKRIDYPGPEGRFLTIGYDGQDVELILWEGSPVTDTDNSQISVSKNPGQIFIESADLRKDFEVLVSKSVTFIEEAPVDYLWGILITALDPDGNRIALRQRK